MPQKVDAALEVKRKQGLTPTEIHVGSDLYNDELKNSGPVIAAPLLRSNEPAPVRHARMAKEYDGVPIVVRPDMRADFLEIRTAE